ncbi:helix-turn-helix domain-containing protein [Marinomonas fungiae]|uniref:AraC family transcriptional regulator n=1 Tax=Marinomonas fungiae TaxID=1137284 RepID=UPI003A8F7711
MGIFEGGMVEDIIGASVRFASYQAGLQSRSYSLSDSEMTGFYYLVLQQSGRSVIRSDSEEYVLLDASMAILNLGAGAKLDLTSGTQVRLIGFEETLRSMIIGSEVESTKLKQLLQQPTVLTVEQTLLEATMLPLFGLLEKEIWQEKNRSLMVISSLIRVLLIQAQRVLGESSNVSSDSNDERLVQQFQQLIEVAFKQRLPLSYYCEKLNMTYDRLHDVCRRSQAKTPKEMIDSRTLMEATYRLRKLPDTIQSISNELGFSDSSQFSHFFKKTMQQSPKQYRQLYRESQRNLSKEQGIDFSDWP